MAVSTIVGLGGSLASRSTSLAALQEALHGAEEAGAETKLLDLRELDLPHVQPGRRRAHRGPAS
jgi:multimeric flavodoxin WrbA